jgi:hypothetical protein
MASAVGRDRPFSEICAPRKTLPPPTTTPSAMPRLWAAIRSAAKRSMVGWWMPNLSGPLKASPESLTITRR